MSLLVINLELEPGQERASRTREGMVVSLDAAIAAVEAVPHFEHESERAVHLERLNRLKRAVQR